MIPTTQGAAVLSPLGLGDPPPHAVLSWRQACWTHRFPRRALSPAPAIPPTLPRICTFLFFFRLLFRHPFRTALERLFFGDEAQDRPKLDPKPTQNPAPHAPQIDIMLRKPHIGILQTLPHFCSFLTFQTPCKSSRNRLQIGFHLQRLTKTTPDRLFSDF